LGIDADADFYFDRTQVDLTFLHNSRRLSVSYIRDNPVSADHLHPRPADEIGPGGRSRQTEIGVSVQHDSGGVTMAGRAASFALLLPRSRLLCIAGVGDGMTGATSASVSIGPPARAR
jgi:hypothetical protein